MRSRLAAAALALLALASVAPATASAASTDPTPRLGHRGRWLTDQHGRAVILHGVNMVAKLPPYRPSALGFGADDAAFLAAQGFNTVRLGIILKGLEPQPGVFDDAYLNDIVRTARILGAAGLRVLLDFHQDLYNERFSGEGFPDWMVQDDGLPAEPDAGFPGNYFVMPAQWRAWDNLWANRPGPRGIGLQDEFALAWRHVAARFKNEPAVMGYDLLNEPWPGSTYPACINPYGCPAFDATTLAEFYRKVIARVREVDRKTLVFYEPTPISAGGPDMHVGDTGDARAALSFHVYCLGATVGLPPGFLGPLSCPLGIDHTFNNANAQADRNGDAILLTEFGATDELEVLRGDAEAADRAMVGWQYWAWWNEDPSKPTPEAGIVRDPHRAPSGDNVKWDKLAVLARAYPRAVAGTPLGWSFSDLDPARTFTMAYVTDTAIGAPTVASVPRRHYPNGYRVVVTGPARVISAPNAALLQLRTTGPGRVTVTVSRRP